MAGSIRVELPEQTKRQFKVLCALNGKTMSEVLRALIDAMIAEDPIATEEEK